MEKMNQVSVSEFMNLTKEEMYDNAVKMVEKYNRLVDICNDSAERIADLMSKDEINEFKKELHSREPGELKIQKLADVVVWADNWIESVKPVLIALGEFETDKDVKQLEAVKKVVLESMERHAVYTNALNKDIADKAAKINLLEKEIEGRKEGYWALKEKYDLMTASEEGWHANAQELVKTCNSKNEEIKKLKEEIEGRKKAFNDLREETANRYIAIETHNDICKTYEKDLDYYKNQERIRTSQLRATESKVDELWKEIENFTREEDDDHGRAGFKRYIEHLIEEEERAVPERFKERLNKEITEIFTKEEETEVNDIPCGSDSIE